MYIHNILFEIKREFCIQKKGAFYLYVHRKDKKKEEEKVV